MAADEELITSYLDKCGINRKWKGYRFLYLAIKHFYYNQTLDCNKICELIASSDEYKGVSTKTIYTTASYAIHNSNIPTSSVYQFIADATSEIRRSEVLN